MPLTKKGRKIKNAMLNSYGSKDKADEVFYASVNAGKLSGVHKKSRRTRKTMRSKRKYD